MWAFGDSFTAGHGCIFGQGKAFSSDYTESFYYKTYINYIDESKKIWPNIVSDNLEYDLLNMGFNGMSTESIFDNVLKNLNNIEKNDLVIIQTSALGRYDFPFLKEKTLFGFDHKKYNGSDNIFDITDSPYFFKTVFATNIKDEYSEDLKDVLQYTNGQENLNEKSLSLNKEKYDSIRNFFGEFISTEKYYERSIWRILRLAETLKNMGILVFIINEDIWPMYLEKPDFLIEMDEKGMSGYIIKNNLTIHSDTNGKIDDWHPSYDGHSEIAKIIINKIKNENTNIHKS